MEKEKVVKLLKEVRDPELGLNIVDLGMVEILEVKRGKVKLKFSPTSPLCPFVPFLLMQIEEKLKSEGYEADIEVSFDWDPSKISENLKEKLDL